MSLLQAFVDTAVFVGRFDVPDVLLGRKGVTKELGNLSKRVSLLGFDPMRTNRFVDSGCACGLLICVRMHSAECNDP